MRSPSHAPPSRARQLPVVGGRRARLRGWPGLLVLVALVGVGLRVAFVLLLRDGLVTGFDARTYHLLGSNLAEGMGYVRPPQMSGGDVVPTAEFGPVLPALLAAAAHLGLSTETQHALVTAVLGGVTIVVVGLLGRRLAGPRVGLVAAGIIALHPLLVQLDGGIAAESPYLLLVAAMLLATTWAWDGATAGRWAVVGLVGGLATLTRPEAAGLVVLVVAPAAAARAWPGWRRVLLAGVVPVLAAAAVVMPWTVRNWMRFDRLVPVSNNIGSVLLGAHCANAYEGVRAGGWDFGCVAAYADADPRNKIVPGSNEAVIYSRWRAEGVRYALEHPGGLLRSTPARLARTWGLYWNVDDQLDYDEQEGRQRALQVAGYVVAVALLPLAAVGAWRLIRRADEDRPLVLLLSAGPVAVTLLVTFATYGSTRFRAAAEPTIAVLAATAIVALIDRRMARPR